ncbi:glycoside hydrolase family 13 protein [Portibacter lacus]|uniref:Neopullulanase SusA n=1 Tax=Portibacter lacus TaxID=1099794 RepID=A0AA37SPI5_9BACT|nr:glycoside hydrolase family 13 protein [Portibacter lacus]GLR15545.1 neopullulanase SusA [Portibacter lacus]
MKKTLLLAILACFIHIQLNAQSIERVEPPNWWIGMEYNEIEIMLYGKDLATLTPKFDKKGVELVSHKSFENENYLFVTIRISADAAPGSLKIDLYKNEKIALSHDYPLEARNPQRKNIEGFNGSDVMYLITPDRFSNGNTDNDNVDGLREKANRNLLGGRHGGDIQGIVNHLDYIKDMGFTSIWLNPLLENDMKTYSYHGYSTTDYYKIDPRYGSNEEYRNLCDVAREKGIKIIMDMIENHCGLLHWWMDDLPTKDWINQWPEYTNTNHRKTVILDPYSTDEDKKQFTDGWFVPSMPDLNQRNPSMATYLIQNTLWWIEYSGISGIRQDTYPYPDMYFMADWTKAVMKEYPHFNIVAEEWYTNPTVVSYWQKGKDNPNGYTSDLKSLMDFPLQHAVVKSLTEEENWHSSWNHAYEMLGLDYLYADPMNMVIFPDNHDMSRIHAQVGKDVDKTKLAIAYFATMRGIPQFYYGTEYLMADSTGDHGEIRSDFPGGWPGEKPTFTSEQIEFKKYMQTILKWRKDKEVIHNGKTLHFAPDNNDVYVFLRYINDDRVIILLNKNEQNVELDFKKYQKYFPKSKAKDIISKQEINLNNPLQLKAMTAYILE